MSKDCRTDLIREIEFILKKSFPLQSVEAVVSEITKTLREYYISKQTTSLTVYVGENEKVLKRYCACLFIDGKSEKTIAQYKRTIEHLFRLVQKTYKEITAYDIRYFLACEKERGVSNRTLENNRANMSAFFQWLAAEDEIPKNPCVTIKPIKYADEQRFPFSAVEIDSLRSACKTTRNRALVEVFLSSGMRVSELSALKVSDINFADKSIRIREGKGGKERITYINDVTAKYLQKHIAETKADGFIFTNQKQEQLRPGGIRYILNKIAETAKVENVHPHRFRRTFATELANRGMQIQEIQKLLGHSNVNTTLEYVCVKDSKVKASYNQYIV